MTTEAMDETSGSDRLRRWARWGLGGALVGLLLVGVILDGAGVVDLEPATVADLVRSAGAWGALALIGLFGLGAVANVPGLVFVGAAVSLYGGQRGFLIALAGAIVAVNVTFLLGRATGLGNSRLLERPMIAKVVAWLHRRPVLSVSVLRLLVAVSPPVNYALSLTRLRFRDFALGSALGLVIPIAVQTVGLSCFMG